MSRAILGVLVYLLTNIISKHCWVGFRTHWCWFLTTTSIIPSPIFSQFPLAQTKIDPTWSKNTDTQVSRLFSYFSPSKWAGKWGQTTVQPIPPSPQDSVLQELHQVLEGRRLCVSRSALSTYQKLAAQMAGPAETWKGWGWWGGDHQIMFMRWMCLNDKQPTLGDFMNHGNDWQKNKGPANPKNFPKSKGCETKVSLVICPREISF